MAEIIRVEDMNVSNEEKKLILRALTDKAFRESLERQVGSGVAELSDAELGNVAGGAGLVSQVHLRGALLSVRNILGRVAAGAEVLCGGGPCGIA